MHFATNYADSDDQERDLRALLTEPSIQSHILKFAAYQALSHGMYRESIDLFNRFVSLDLGDHLAIAGALGSLGDWQGVERLLNDATRVAWPHVTPGQNVLLYRALLQVRQNKGFEYFTDEYLEKLRSIVIEQGDDPEITGFEFGRLCNVNQRSLP